MEKMLGLSRVKRAAADDGRLAFRRASYSVKNSHTGQALEFAWYCNSKGLDPEDTGTALMNHPGHMEFIRQEAIEQHRKAGRGPVEISPAQVEDVVNVVSTLASEFIRALTPEQMRFALTHLYAEARASTPPGKDSEPKYEAAVIKLAEENVAANPHIFSRPPGGFKNW